MPRLTITLSEEKHHALKEASLLRGKTIRQLVEESLDYYGIKSADQAVLILEQARQNAAMEEEQAMALALKETQAYRKRQKK